MQNAFFDIADIVARNGDLRRGLGELFQPAGNVLNDFVIGPLAVRIDPLQVVFRPRAVDGDLDAEMGRVLGDEPLHPVVAVEEPVGREAEPIAVEPGVAQLIGPDLEIIADPVDEIDLEEGLPADEIPDDGAFRHELPLPQGDNRWLFRRCPV